MLTVAISNKKGGVGKTTTAYNLAAGLQRLGDRVLAIDLDSQCNLTKFVGCNESGPTSYGVIMKETEIENAIQHLEYFDFIQGSLSLLSADKVLPEGINRLMRLRDALDKVSDKYDWCVLDNAPAINVITVNSLMASDFVIIPAEANELSTDGIVSVFKSLLDVKKYVNPNIKVAGILLTRYKPNTVVNQQYTKIFTELAKKMRSKVFNAKIRENINLTELPAIHEPIYDYRPQSNGAEDYMAFVKEFVWGAKRSDVKR